jgi:hypothetical protein
MTGRSAAVGADAGGSASPPLTTTLPVLGLPTRFEARSPAVMAAVEAAFGAWRGREEETAGVATVRIEVVEGDEGPAPHAPLAFRAPRPGVTVVRSPGSVGTADAGARRASASVTRALVADRAHFRYGMLESLVLGIHTHHDREPLHAAALVRGGTVALLAGPVGVGKSTLCLAGARAGMAILAEDCVFLQLEPRPRIWGFPGWVHVPPDAPVRVPGLPGGTPLLANGVPKLAFRTAELGALPASFHAARAAVCIVRRGEGPGSLHPLTPAEAAAALLEGLEPGFDLFAATIGARVARLVEGGAWLLRLPADAAAGLALVHRAMDAFEGRPAA